MKANVQTVFETFKTDDLTTSRILNNCSYGFFVSHFGIEADNKWKEAHPFKYENHDSINYHEISIDFIKNNFELLATNQLTISSGWKHDKEAHKAYWDIEVTYRKEPINYIN